MKARVAALLPALLLTACGGDNPHQVQGYVEVDLLRLASSQSGRLDKLLVDTGDNVQVGQQLFHLEATPELASAQQSQAQVAASNASALDLATGKRPVEIDAIRAQLNQARAQLKLAQDQLRRSQAVFAQGFVSRDAMDQQQTAVRADTAHVAELQADLQTAELAGRPQARQAAEAQVAAAQAANRLNTWKLDEKTVLAPQAARVEQVYYRPGEWVNAGDPVLDLYPLNRVKLRFFVAETELAAIKIGQTVNASCDGCQSFKATVRFISNQAEFTPPEIYSRDQRAKFVYLVEAWPEHPENLHAGQPVDVSLP